MEQELNQAQQQYMLETWAALQEAHTQAAAAAALEE
jgi:hypothetical protein